MNKVLIWALIALGSFCIPAMAEDTRPAEDWENVEGVTVQPDERVEQIKAYKKKSDEAERTKLKQGWEQEGIQVQSQDRVEHLNEIEKKRREKEIREIKCTMCTMRCNIVRDAGQTTCNNATDSPGNDTCQEKGDDFLASCLHNCETCGPVQQTAKP